MNMKPVLLLMACVAGLFAGAQMKEGRVVYERTVQIQLPNFRNLDPEMAQRIPRSRTDQFELLFSDNKTLWQYLPSASAEDVTTVAGPGMMIRMAGGTNDVIYTDLVSRSRVDKREMFDRSFLVADSLEKGSWKMTQETKKILGYTAFKAVTQRTVTRPRVTMENGEMKREDVTDTVDVIAWFTPEIPVSAGPDMQGQLPGLILELESNNGQSITRAIEVSPKVNVAKIKEPKGGRKMTAAEFQKEREKMVEEMRRNMPAGNVIRMN